MSVPGLSIDANGISGPSYAEVLAALQADYQSIYGSDVVLTPDSQDGQLLSIFAQAIYDAQQAGIAVYLAFSPTTAQGAGLSQVVKINGIRRNVPTKSTATVTIIGTVGTIINNGVVGDSLGLGTQWDLPASVTIPGSASIDVTATCSVEGATLAAAGSLTQILTPTLGWQSVTNAATATAGAPVETDAALRRRQSQSVSLAGDTVIDAIFANVANVAGVTRLFVYENDSDVTDANGVPSHSISVVVQGGIASEIAAAIAEKKTPGAGTYGTTSVVVTDSRGVPNTINFFVLSQVTVQVEVTIAALTGYLSTTGDAIKQAIADYLSGLEIGEDSYTTRLYTPANLDNGALSDTYVVTLIRQRRSGGFSTADVNIAFNEAAVCLPANVTLLP